jgi:hypothetical protein
MHRCYRGIFVGSFLVLGSALSVRAGTTPVLQYTFPASWNGTGTIVTDQSSAGNNGIVSTTATKHPTFSTPPDSSSNDAIVTNAGGVQTTNKLLLSNSAIATAGGFSYSVDFFWDGTDNSAHIGKIIDYAGTESLQIDNPNVTNGTANLDFIFTTEGVAPSPDTTVGPAIQIAARTWYQATAVFNTEGNAVAVDGTLSGLATLFVGPVGGSSIETSVPVTKTTYGDGLNRPIGIGELGFPSTSSTLVLFNGAIYNPEVDLGVLPEPASMAVLCLAGPMLLSRRRRHS